MAAYPFRKMTTGKLRSLLRDERDRDRHLSESPACPQTDSPIYQSISIQKKHSNPAKISTDAR
jgi:hypothetical protein